jgi:hypothetical protein
MKPKNRYSTLPTLAAYALLCGCSGPDAGRSSGDGAPTTTPADAWLGRWNGPEGTFLLLEKADDGYDVTIQNLDGARVFRGVALGERVQFERDGMTESIRATDGPATGMKWLTDKSNCLTIRDGEGYCRD